MRRVVLTALAAIVPAAISADVVKYAHLDGVGSALALTDQQGAVAEQHDYLPFGEEWCGTAPCGAVPAGEPIRFTGKERDSETKLDYFGARYYGAGTGRFTTIDPVTTLTKNLVDPQRWNRYMYARNNPLRFVDPDGEEIYLLVYSGDNDGQKDM